MEATERDIEIYTTEDGKAPFTEWINSVRDIRAQAKILVRLDRVRLGNFGDYDSVGEGVEELRINYGPGYRVYFGQIGSKVVLLLCGGDKSTQKQDIRQARIYWKDYRRRHGRE